MIPFNQQLTPAQQAKNTITERIRATYNQVQVAFNVATGQFWHNPQATPQQVNAEFGTDAATLWEFSNYAAQMLGINQVMPSGWDSNINQNGSVTLIPPSGDITQ